MSPRTDRILRSLCATRCLEIGDYLRRGGACPNLIDEFLDIVAGAGAEACGGGTA